MNYDLEAARLKKDWAENPRWKGIKRGYTAEDVIRLGATYRLIMFLDTPHIAGLSAEADFAANMRPAGAAATQARFVFQMYNARLDEESNRLAQRYPLRAHYTV